MKVVEFENSTLVIRNDSSVVIVNEDNIVELGNNLVNTIVCCNRVMINAKEAIADRDTRIKGLEKDIAGMTEEITNRDAYIDTIKHNIDLLHKENERLSNRILELTEAANQKPIVTGYAANYHGSKLVDIDDKFICDCGTTWRAAHVAECLRNGQVDIDTVKLLFIDRPKKMLVDSDGDSQGV